ncbi:serpin family protein [uncultured Parolsenella sp.]|uniref:serpin family protein n=1 Tax=uncultured Parolsenella sp. TaxID=2083008 RepID=UPI0025DA229B|nr:serpin family protein [uncultured Parolsenella sp.]
MDNTPSMASQQAWRVAWALGRELVSQNANTVWSPACVASLLAVAREGASGTTRRELDALLGADNRLGTGNFLEKDDPFGLKPLGSWGYKDYAASMAVAAWISNAADPSDAFLRRCADCGVRVSIADLGDPQAGREISDWISKQTRGLLSPSVELSPLALVCLVSALYLKDAWEDPFEEFMTKAGTFHAPSGDIQVAYMNGIRSGKVIEKSGFTVFELALSQGGSMLFALPDGDSVRFENALPLLEQLSRGEGNQEDIDLSIPRFECEATVSSLDSLLTTAGVSTARAMELVPMVGEAVASTQIVHGAKLSLDERGIEAGAYTKMIVCAGALPFDLPERRRIILDRPFYVALASRNGTPLFIGSVSAPTEITHSH